MSVEELWQRRSDAGLVGFDDFELSHLMPRPVTVTKAMARQAVELLFDRIKGGRSWPRTVVLPTTLIDRGLPAKG